MPEIIRWGVIGSGGIARRRTIPEGIVPAENAELVAVYDTDQAVNLEVARRFGAKASGSLEQLLLEGIDAVYVATPAGLHCEQTLACAGAGKHVLCEKPLGLTVEQAEQMIAACRRAKAALGTAFMMRFHTRHLEALRMIEEGRLGKPVYGRAQLSCWYPPLEGAWRQDPASGGGGSLIDMGGHCIDLLEMFFGRVEKVSCFVNSSVHPYRSEDSAVACLSFAGGALATVDTFFCIPDDASRNVLELYGSKGSILAAGTIGQGDSGSMTAFLSEDGAGYDAAQARAGGQGMIISPEPVNTYYAEIREFSQAVIDGREPSTGADLGLQSQRVLAACYQSARSGKAVAV
ncbi:MAG: Gfo/Idh/MocA family oxidoreductase [Candidatus Glassbacteria bacterium]|nr:Gfo/Idh/MocA family oxidoreductase [Candidatus Glassbacteria bacterium]